MLQYRPSDLTPLFLHRFQKRLFLKCGRNLFHLLEHLLPFYTAGFCIAHAKLCKLCLAGTSGVDFSLADAGHNEEEENVRGMEYRNIPLGSKETDHFIDRKVNIRRMARLFHTTSIGVMQGIPAFGTLPDGGSLHSALIQKGM